MSITPIMTKPPDTVEDVEEEQLEKYTSLIENRKWFRMKRRDADTESLSSSCSSVGSDHEHSDDDLDTKKFAALRILIFYRCWRRREERDRLRWQILNRLVLSLQRLFRARKRRVMEIVSVPSLVSGRDLLPELLREERFEVPKPPLLPMSRKREVYEKRGSADTVNIGDELDEPYDVVATPRETEVPVEFAPRPFREVLVFSPSPEDKRAMALCKIQACARSYIWRDFLSKMKGEFILDDIVKATMDQAESDPPDVTTRGNVVDLEPVDVYVPADVQGVLEHGTVVAGSEGIVGKDIGATKDEEWIVDEVEDLGEFDQYDASLNQAASIIQRFVRRRASRRRFHLMVEEAIKAAKDGKPFLSTEEGIVDTTLPAGDSPTNAESSITSSCALM